MLSSNNILSPAHGAPLATPTQDMVLGAYYLTYGAEADELAELQEKLARGRRPPASGRTCSAPRRRPSSPTSNRDVKLHDLAEFRRTGWQGGHVLTTVGRIIYNDRIERALEEALGDEFDPTDYEFVNQSIKKRDSCGSIDALVQALRRRRRSPWCSTRSRTSGSSTRRWPASRSPRTTSSSRRARGRSSTGTRRRSPRSRTSTTWA